MVAVIFWNRGNADSRKWNSYYKYHPQCWIDQGLDYLKRNPYVPQRRVRKQILCEEDKRKRFLLVRKFHKIIQMRKNCNHSYPDHVLTDIRLTQQMLDIILEIATLGGVPKLWTERL
ncbi:hypothetical protein LCGC14_0598700 [marine sediment metagenome]|uniref:Uncharacterized protein n=1 Tax=marine sediment metagenome TaxID=412755 RepID=A0A0F9RV21_9ZZZZ